MSQSLVRIHLLTYYLHVISLTLYHHHHPTIYIKKTSHSLISLIISYNFTSLLSSIYPIYQCMKRHQSILFNKRKKHLSCLLIDTMQKGDHSVGGHNTTWMKRYSILSFPLVVDRQVLLLSSRYTSSFFFFFFVSFPFLHFPSLIYLTRTLVLLATPLC